MNLRSKTLVINALRRISAATDAAAFTPSDDFARFSPDDGEYSKWEAEQATMAISSANDISLEKLEERVRPRINQVKSAIKALQVAGRSYMEQFEIARDAMLLNNQILRQAIQVEDANLDQEATLSKEIRQLGVTIESLWLSIEEERVAAEGKYIQCFMRHGHSDKAKYLGLRVNAPLNADIPAATLNAVYVGGHALMKASVVNTSSCIRRARQSANIFMTGTMDQEANVTVLEYAHEQQKYPSSVAPGTDVRLTPKGSQSRPTLPLPEKYAQVIQRAEITIADLYTLICQAGNNEVVGKSGSLGICFTHGGLIKRYLHHLGIHPEDEKFIEPQYFQAIFLEVGTVPGGLSVQALPYSRYVNPDDGCVSLAPLPGTQRTALRITPRLLVDDVDIYKGLWAPDDCAPDEIETMYRSLVDERIQMSDKLILDQLEVKMLASGHPRLIGGQISSRELSAASNPVHRVRNHFWRRKISELNDRLHEKLQSAEFITAASTCLQDFLREHPQPSEGDDSDWKAKRNLTLYLHLTQIGQRLATDVDHFQRDETSDRLVPRIAALILSKTLTQDDEAQAILATLE